MPPSRTRLTCLCAALGVALAAAPADAARLGEVRVLSARGEPLQAVVDLEDDADGEAESAAPALGSPSRYALGGLAFPEALRDARVTRVRRGDGRWAVRVQGARPVDAEGLVLLLTIEGDGYTSTRTYPVELPDRPAAGRPATPSESAPPVPGGAPVAPPSAVEGPSPMPAPTVPPSPAAGGGDPPRTVAGPTDPPVAAARATDPPPAASPASPGTAPARPAAPRAAPARAGDRLSLSAGGLGRAASETAGGGTGAQRAIAHEAAMREARSRIAQLESIEADLRRLITLREQAIAAVSAEIGRLAPRGTPTAPASVAAAPAATAVPKAVGAAAATMLPAASRAAPQAPADPIQDVDARLVAAALAAGGAGIVGLWWLRRRRRAAERPGGDDGPDGPGGSAPTFAPYPLIDPSRRA